MRLADALLVALKDYGASEIFGIPGDFALPFFERIERSNILPLYTLSHEPGVGFAADASARYRSALGVAAVTYGAGALNMVNAVATAYAEKSPLVVISGAPGAKEGWAGLGLHHQVKNLNSQHLIYNEVTAAQAVLSDAATAPAEIARVLTAALHLSRPVYLEFPRDMVDADVETVPSYSPPPADLESAREAAAEVMARLRAAKRPALLLGVEVRRHGIEGRVAELARTLAIPTVTSFMARGVLSAPDAPVIGTYLGLAGDESIREIVEQSDGLLILGAILCDTNFGISRQQIDMRTVVHAFDGAVRLRTHAYPRVPLPALVEALLDVAEPLGSRTAVRELEYPHDLTPDDQPLTPTDVAAAVNDLFARHGRMPIASDTGDCLFTATEIVPTALTAPAYYATMGPGVPFGIGLQVASGCRTLVMVGDGAFQMTGWELGNCRRYGWNPIVLVFNNAAWGMLKAFQAETRYNDLDDWQFAALAARLGGEGRRVTTRRELVEALAAAHADESRWQLIEIMLPRHEMSRTLRRFVTALQQRTAQAQTASSPV